MASEDSPANRSTGGGSWTRLLFVGGLLLATGLLVVLAWKYRVLRQEYRELRRQRLAPEAGAYLPARAVATVGGDSLMLGDPGRGRAQLLYFLRTTCSACSRSVPALRSLARTVRADSDVQVVGVYFDSARAIEDYRVEHDLRFPAVSVLDRRTVSLFRVGIVPLVVLVGSDGRVLHARPGVIEAEAALDTLLQAIRARLESSSAERKPTGIGLERTGTDPSFRAGRRAGFIAHSG